MKKINQHVYRLIAAAAILLVASCTTSTQVLRKQLPDKLVVLTFDDASASHATYVAPLLKKYGFGGTFFVCEFPPDFEDKTKYMSWEQIQQLHQLGFEIASHTRSHTHVAKMSKEQQAEELQYIEDKCKELGITIPVTFAYPGYSTHPSALETLQERGYLFARAGGSRPYNPTTDHPYLIPSYSTTGNTPSDKARVMGAIGEAKDGKIVVFTIHGVPDVAHDWVSTPPELFEVYLQYLKDNNYQVVALRDLKRYLNVEQARKQVAPDYKNLVNRP
ncbi:polysaccharide deacetylase family protein [Pontibacter qinzhouensis]|uniref:Polysaccharide deacetylase family protein n=1 Tax=Pontibacter qinzhouensis TaxID=2603253 RepID=A0A5C8KC18_9BACT|nr:polysaccharide deacetylase family protein [Pontibacter qinzhouensis]TXK48909.1 polysaccharide deacetylase family protein [Pontibacter qinzhouensis]